MTSQQSQASRWTAPTMGDVISSLNASVERIVESVHPTEWDENHISFLLVQAIRNALWSWPDTQPSQGPSHPTYLRAEAYKVTGTLERTHGDIAIAIHHPETSMTGLGFYEAKAADHNGRYPAFSMRQLRRLTSSTPRLSLLLYERVSSPVADGGFAFVDRNARPGDYARVRALGANLASRVRDPGRLATQPETFGYHFVTRYLSGRDLDYSRSPLDALQRWLSATKRTPPVLVSVTVSQWEPVTPVPLLPDYEQIPIALGTGGPAPLPLP